MSAAEHEVVAPYVISMLWPKTYARPIVEPQPTTLRLLHRNFQPFKTPQPLNSFVIHMPAFVAKHHRNTTITVPAIRSRLISTNSAVLFTPAVIRLVGHVDLTTSFCHILPLRKKYLSCSKLLNNLLDLITLAWHRTAPHLRPNS